MCAKIHAHNQCQIAHISKSLCTDSLFSFLSLASPACSRTRDGHAMTGMVRLTPPYRSLFRPGWLWGKASRTRCPEPAPGHHRATAEQDRIAQERQPETAGRQYPTQHRAHRRANLRAAVEDAKGTGPVV